MISLCTTFYCASKHVRKTYYYEQFITSSPEEIFVMQRMKLFYFNEAKRFRSWIMSEPYLFAAVKTDPLLNATHRVLIILLNDVATKERKLLPTFPLVGSISMLYDSI